MFDEHFYAGEDWDLSIRAQELGYILLIANKPLVHKEKVKSLHAIIIKKNYYSQNIHLYAQKHPEEFKLQSSLKIRLGIYLKNWKVLFGNPPYTFGFIFLKALSWHNWSRL
jgi:GT2 family glycosyltransferase